MSREVDDYFVEALRGLEEEGGVEPLVELHTEDCEVGNVSVPGTFSEANKACASSGRATVAPAAR
jgi:hypothetical protein